MNSADSVNANAKDAFSASVAMVNDIIPPTYSNGKSRKRLSGTGGHTSCPKSTATQDSFPPIEAVPLFSASKASALDTGPEKE